MAACRSVMLHFQPAMVTSYRQAPGCILLSASLLWPCKLITLKCLYNASLSNGLGMFNASAPPSAVVRFFTAWKLKPVMSAMAPTRLSPIVAPKEWAASLRTRIRPSSCCTSPFGMKTERCSSAISMNCCWSAGSPPMSTGMMHLVRGVMAFRTASGSMVKSSRTSTITGLAPT